MSKKRSEKRPPNKKDEDQVMKPGENQDLEGAILRMLNEPPDKNNRSVVLPAPAYLDRTIDDRRRFMERARPKITKDVLKRIIRGEDNVMGNEITMGRPMSMLGQTLLSHDFFRDCHVAFGSEFVYVPVGGNSFRAGGDIEVPIGIDEPSWWPGRDGGGGGGGFEGGEDGGDVVYMPITYEEFIEMLQLLFDLPFLKQTDEDKLLVYSLRMRGTKKTGPMARLDTMATAVARLERFRALYNAHPEDFEHIEDPDDNPSVEDFPFDNVDLRFKRVEERWDPDSKAVVFFELDTSGSMGGEPLAMAKFYFLLNLIWLKTRYNDVAVVYIAHNAEAHRVRSEKDFFRLDAGYGTMFVPAHELVWQLANTEFAGDGWNKYCLHATDGYCFDPESEVTSWIEKLVRGGFNYFGYFEPILSFGWGDRLTPGMSAVRNTAGDVRQHCGWARVSDLDQVPEAMMEIMSGDKNANQ